MTPWEAFRVAVAGRRKAVALRLGVSVSLIDKQTECPKSCGGEGEINPVQKVLETILALHEAGAENPDFLLHYLAGELGHVAVKANGEPLDMLDAAAATEKFGHFLSTFAQAVADGAVTPSEAERVAAAIQEHMSVMGRQLTALRRVVASAEESSASERIGPRRAPVRFYDLRRVAG